MPHFWRRLAPKLVDSGTRFVYSGWEDSGIASSKIEREDLKESFVKWLMDVKDRSPTLDIVSLTTTPTLMRPTNRTGTRSVAAIDWSGWRDNGTKVSFSQQGFE